MMATDLELFAEADSEIRQAVQYGKWGTSNKGERVKYEAYADAIKRGESPTPPVLVTHFGKHLIATGRLALNTFAPSPEPVPDPTPPTDLNIAPPVGPFQVMDGGGTQSSAIFDRSVSGVTRKKLDIRNYREYGYGLMAWPAQTSTGRATIEDIVTNNIGQNKAMDGTGEAGLWIGQTADVRRFVCRNSHWMGLWTGARCNNSLFEDFELLDMPHVGLYVEHVTSNTIFRRGRIVSQATGINVEWWYGGEGSHNLVFEDLDIYCPVGSHWTHSGMFLDAGTYGCTIRRVRFWGPGNAIWLPNKRAGSGAANVVDEATIKFENQGHRIRYHDNNMG